MKRISFKLLILATMTTTTGLIHAGSGDSGPTLKRIAEYRTWTRVTPKPVLVELSSIGG